MPKTIFCDDKYDHKTISLYTGARETHGVFQCVRQVVAQFVDGSIDGGFSVVVLQVLVYRLDQELTQLTSRTG